jgi:hypothetical protein
VLFQFGKISFITVRQSDSPITNLHLNNRALSAPVPGILPSCLHLSDEQAADMETLCARAVSCFPGIRSAGIDILLEKGRGTPEIIEMNGQGDLLYQDIYGRNKIYLEQVEQYLKLFTPGT